MHAAEEQNAVPMIVSAISEKRNRHDLMLMRHALYKYPASASMMIGIVTLRTCLALEIADYFDGHDGIDLKTLLRGLEHNGWIGSYIDGSDLYTIYQAISCTWKQKRFGLDVLHSHREQIQDALGDNKQTTGAVVEECIQDATDDHQIHQLLLYLHDVEVESLYEDDILPLDERMESREISILLALVYGRSKLLDIYANIRRLSLQFKPFALLL